MTRGDWLWCYRAHCMQAYTSKFAVSFRSASVALKDMSVIDWVLLSLPLSLVDSVRDACLIR